MGVAWRADGLFLTATRCPLIANRYSLKGDETGFRGDLVVWVSLVRRPWSIFLTSTIWLRVDVKSVSVIAFRSRATMKWFSSSEDDASA